MNVNVQASTGRVNRVHDSPFLASLLDPLVLSLLSREAGCSLVLDPLVRASACIPVRATACSPLLLVSLLVILLLSILFLATGCASTTSCLLVFRLDSFEPCLEASSSSRANPCSLASSTTSLSNLSSSNECLNHDVQHPLVLEPLPEQ